MQTQYHNMSSGFLTLFQLPQPTVGNCDKETAPRSFACFGVQSLHAVEATRTVDPLTSNSYLHVEKD